MEVFNRTLALERLGGDDERLKELLTAFQQDIPTLFQELQDCVERKWADRMESRVAGLRESVREIGAEGLEHLTDQIIVAARERDYPQLETLMTHMSMELDWLLRILDDNRCSGNL